MKIIDKFISNNGNFVKFLQKTDDNLVTETAFIEEENRYIICFASQLGCQIGCTICYNGICKNFYRNLTSEEIVKETGNEPSKEELSIALNVSVEEVECAMTWGNNRIAKSLDYFIHEGEDMIYSDVLGLEDNSLLLLEDKMFLKNCQN